MYIVCPTGIAYTSPLLHHPPHITSNKNSCSLCLACSPHPCSPLDFAYVENSRISKDTFFRIAPGGRVLCAPSTLVTLGYSLSGWLKSRGNSQALCMPLGGVGIVSNYVSNPEWSLLQFNIHSKHLVLLNATGCSLLLRVIPKLARLSGVAGLHHSGAGEAHALLICTIPSQARGGTVAQC